jgi:hypothetical protein
MPWKAGCLRKAILNITTLCHPWHRDIPFILNITTLCHPWHRDIPFILNIKKQSFVALHFIV